MLYDAAHNATTALCSVGETTYLQSLECYTE